MLSRLTLTLSRTFYGPKNPFLLYTQLPQNSEQFPKCLLPEAPY